MPVDVNETIDVPVPTKSYVEESESESSSSDDDLPHKETIDVVLKAQQINFLQALDRRADTYINIMRCVFWVMVASAMYTAIRDAVATML